MTNETRAKRFWGAKIFLAAGMSAVMGLVNVGGLYAQETSFWSARRGASQRVRGFGGSMAPSKEESAKLLSALPRVSAVDLRTPSIPGGTGLASTESVAVGPRTGDWLGRLVMPYGSVNGVYFSPKKNAPLVVHIQDAHGIEEAQRNMAAMIGALGQDSGVTLLGLEGAWGPFSLETHRHFPDPKMTEDLANFLIKRGLIAGPEYAGLTLPQSPEFVGLEEKNLYESNVWALKEAYKIREPALKHWEALEEKLIHRKSLSYSQALKTFDRHFVDYHRGKEPLAPYVEYLTDNLKRLGSTDARNLRQLRAALQREKALDFREVETEQRSLVEKLAATLPMDRLRGLMEKSLDDRAGRTSAVAYHEYLKRVCQEGGISLESYPKMWRYIEYVRAADKIDRRGLLEELARVERELPECLARTSVEKELVALTDDHSLLGRLLRHEMTLEDWTNYKSRGEEIVRGEGRLAGQEAPGDFVFNEKTLAPFEDFCRYAQSRNAALVENLSKQMRESHKTKGILVAGGFHTEGLTALWREKGISYVVLTPNIQRIPPQNNYLDVLAKDAVPLEQLLAGDRIYLSKPVAMADANGSIAALWEGLRQWILDWTRKNPGSRPTENEISEAAVKILRGTKKSPWTTRLRAWIQFPVSRFWHGMRSEKVLIQLWDPWHQNLKWLLPVAVLFPSLVGSMTGFSPWVNLLTMGAVGLVGIQGMVPLFLETEHKIYPTEERRKLVSSAKRIALGMLITFLVAYGFLSPEMGKRVADLPRSFGWVAWGEGKTAFILSSLTAVVFGWVDHMIHNRRTFRNYGRWLEGKVLGPLDLLPLSGRRRPSPGGRTTAQPVPAFAKMKINIPSGMTRENFLFFFMNFMKQYFQTEKEKKGSAFDELCSLLEKHSPEFFEANRELLTGSRSFLLTDPNFVGDIVNTAIFWPLNANAKGYPPDGAWIETTNQWMGWTYLGEELWIGENKAPANVLAHGIGLMDPTLKTKWADSFLRNGEALKIREHILKTEIDKLLHQARQVRGNNPFANIEKINRQIKSIEQKRRTLQEELRELFERAIDEGQRARLREFLKETIFAKLVQKGVYCPAPETHFIDQQIRKMDSDFRWEAFEGEPAVHVSLFLAQITATMEHLLEMPEIGLLYFKRIRSKIIEEKYPPNSPEKAIQTALSPNPQLIAKTEAEVEKAFSSGTLDHLNLLKSYIDIMKGLQQRFFVGFDERYEKVYGKKPDSHTIELAPIRKTNDSLSIIPSATIGHRNNNVHPPEQPKMTANGVGSPLKPSSPTIEEVTPDAPATTTASLPTETPSEILERLRVTSPTSILSITEKIEELEKAMNRVPEEEKLPFRRHLEDSRTYLAMAIEDSVNSHQGNSVPSLALEHSAPLGFGEEERRFLEAYNSSFSRGEIPTVGAISTTLDTSEENVLEIHEKIIRQFTNWNHFPLFFDEVEMMEAVDNEIPLNGNGEDTDYLVAIDQRYSQKLLDGNIKTAIQRMKKKMIGHAQADGPEILKSRTGMHKKGIHQIRTNGFDIFSVWKGRTIVILWIGTVADSHGSEGRAHPDVSRLVLDSYKNLSAGTPHFYLLTKEATVATNSTPVAITPAEGATGAVGVILAMAGGFIQWVLRSGWGRDEIPLKEATDRFARDHSAAMEDIANNLVIAPLAMALAIGDVAFSPWGPAWMAGWVVVGAWGGAFLLSHAVAKHWVQKKTGRIPSVLKAARLLRIYAVPLLLSLALGSLLEFFQLSILWPLFFIPGIVSLRLVQQQHEGSTLFRFFPAGSHDDPANLDRAAMGAVIESLAGERPNGPAIPQDLLRKTRVGWKLNGPEGFDLSATLQAVQRVKGQNTNRNVFENFGASWGAAMGPSSRIPFNMIRFSQWKKKDQQVALDILRGILKTGSHVLFIFDEGEPSATTVYEIETVRNLLFRAGPREKAGVARDRFEALVAHVIIKKGARRNMNTVDQLYRKLPDARHRALSPTVFTTEAGQSIVEQSAYRAVTFPSIAEALDRAFRELSVVLRAA